MLAGGASRRPGLLRARRRSVWCVAVESSAAATPLRIDAALADSRLHSRACALAVDYLPLALPLAFATVIGGIDNTESAAAAGDAYDTRAILLTEGVSTLVAGLFGGVIQTTPYIGHPAYKRMGGRAAYTLATALFVGLGGMLGYLSWLVHALPEVVVVPILVYVGLEIAGQCFHAVPARHAPAVAIVLSAGARETSCLIVVNQMLGGAGDVGAVAARSLRRRPSSRSRCSPPASSSRRCCSARATAFVIDGRDARGRDHARSSPRSPHCFGVIHSPLPGGAAFLPWRIETSVPFAVASGYVGVAALVVLAARLPTDTALEHDP